MTDYRRKLWLNIMEDLGPPEGCVVPTWLICIYTALFPLQGLKVLIDHAVGYDPLRMTWKIHGISFSDRLFCRMVLAKGELYRFTTVNGVVTVEQVPTTENNQ